MIILLIIFLIVVISTIVYFKTRRRNKTIISFKDSLDLTNLPIVTFRTKSAKKLNFLIDTGSSDCFIASTVEELLGKNYIKEETELDVTSFGGTKRVRNSLIKTCIIKGKYTFEISAFTSEHLNEVFSQIKSQYGVQVHGILGTSFLDKYKYIIDFKDYIIYQK